MSTQSDAEYYENRGLVGWGLDRGLVGWGLDLFSSFLQAWAGLFTFIPTIWVLRRFVLERSQDGRTTPLARLTRSCVLWLLTMAVNAAVLLCLLICFVAFVALTAGLSAESMAADNVPARLFATAFDVAGLVFALISLGGSVNYEGDYTVYSKVVRFRLLLWKLIGTMLLLGLSLLPLSVLLLAVPAFVSQESVLDDTTPGRASWLRRTLKRGFALMTAVVVLVTLIAVSVEFVSRLPLPEHGSFGVIAKTFTPAVADFMGKTQRERDAALAKIEDKAVRDFLKTPLHERLPPAMIEHWPFVILGIYALDIVILLFIGKVPLAYNLRNVRVRWKTNLMTAMAFTAVIGLLAFLLAFVNGMNNLTENSGVPGNVFVLSDGSTDEIFSNLGYGDLDNVERVVVELDEKDRVLKTPIKVKQLERGGKTVALASRETYYSINQPVPNTNPPRRRFVQVRSIEDAEVAAEVHNIQLYPGGKWFRSAGVNDKSQIECVLGEGVAGVLGEDTPTKKPLVTGDVFVLGEVEWVVTGLMKSEGTTFGSEIWVKRFSRIYQPFGKEKYTTLVMRTEQDTRDAARAMAHHLSKRYTQQKLKAFAEPDYYAELTKTNNFFLTAVVVVAVVMAIGGVFGMMTTMFASIAQRIRDIGVLRLLGFKRWQVMVSFMLESLTIAVIGGALGVFVAWLLADGRASTSTLSSGGGGPGGKSIALRIDVDAQVMAMGMLFTLVMGRLGGLVPALSAMRMKILDSLR